jgi:hypothetical protein
MLGKLKIAILLGSFVLVLQGGCAKRLPDVVPVEGTLLLNGKPLAKASVTFVPLLEEFGTHLPVQQFAGGGSRRTLSFGRRVASPLKSSIGSRWSRC